MFLSIELSNEHCTAISNIHTALGDLMLYLGALHVDSTQKVHLGVCVGGGEKTMPVQQQPKPIAKEIPFHKVSQASCFIKSHKPTTELGIYTH